MTALSALALLSTSCGGDDPNPATPTEIAEPTITQAPEEPPTTTVSTETPEPAAVSTTTTVEGTVGPEESSGMTDEISLEAIVYEYLADDPPPTVTDENLRCVTDAVVGSLTPERSAEIALVLAAGSAPLAIPIGALTDEEADLIAASAEPCLDWAMLIADGIASEGPNSSAPPGLQECYAAAAQADGFTQVALRVAIFNSPEDEAALFPFVASCFRDVFLAEQAASMEQAGISPASQACVLEAVDFDLLTASMVGQVPSDDVAAQLMLGMMSALTECFTDEELQQIGMGTPADQ